MSTVMERDKLHQTEQKEKTIDGALLKYMTMLDDKAFWVASKYLNDFDVKTEPDNFPVYNQYEEATKRILSATEKDVLRDCIIEHYAKIDYLSSASDNSENFFEIERMLKTLQISDFCRSSQKRNSHQFFLFLLFDKMRDYMEQVKQLTISFNMKDNWNELQEIEKLWEIENNITNNLFDLLYITIENRLSSFDSDEELKRISRNTLTHNYLHSLFQRRKKEKTAIYAFLPNRSSQDELSTYLTTFLQFLYYSKNQEDKREFRSAVITNYRERHDMIPNSTEYNKALQNFVIRDFQGELSRLIKVKRTEKKWTQKQLAEASGVERSMIAKVENMNAITSLETAIKLLTALDIELTFCPLVGSNTQQTEEGCE